MTDAAVVKEFHHDVFISYSRRDSDFAKALEKALRAFSPLKNCPSPTDVSMCSAMRPISPQASITMSWTHTF